jgi:hypothetical protein
MEQVNVWKCEFCKKTSFQKGSIKKHERKCFHNPETHSCATCIWFSPLHGMYPSECFIGASFKNNDEDIRTNLRTQCDSWNSAELLEEYEIFKDKELTQLLISGNINLISMLEVYSGCK